MDRIFFNIGNQDETDFLDFQAAIVKLFMLGFSWKLKQCAPTSYKLAAGVLYDYLLNTIQTIIVS